jgi:hypothetical protein
MGITLPWKFPQDSNLFNVHDPDTGEAVARDLLLGAAELEREARGSYFTIRRSDEVTA